MPNNNWNLIGFALATLAKWQSRHPLASGEQELLSDYTAGAVRSVASPGVLQSLREATRATGHKDQRINIRLSSGDLQAIRTRALQEGVPYQTLISSVLHKYVSGTLQEQPAIQAGR